MSKTKSTAMLMKDNTDPEIRAMSIVIAALKDLDETSQMRVLTYVAERLGLDGRREFAMNSPSRSDSANSDVSPPLRTSTQLPASEPSESNEGISAVALRWMRRNGVEITDLSRLFSLGVEEIDFVAQRVPGKSKRSRMLNVVLMKGIAAYLSTGVPRVTHEQLKEACLHYDAYDGPNFARHLKSFAPVVAGTKGAGYTLTARGITEATETIKGLITPKKGE